MFNTKISVNCLFISVIAAIGTHLNSSALSLLIIAKNIFAALVVIVVVALVVVVVVVAVVAIIFIY